MVTADTLATQGSQLRQILPTTPLLQIIAKALGNVSRPLAAGPSGGNNPPLSRDQWLAATSDLQGVAESDLLAFITDQLARILIYRGSPGLTISAESVLLESDDASISGSASLTIADPACVAGTATTGAPLKLIDSNGLCEYGLVGENFQTVTYATVSASRNIANTDLGVTLVYSGSGNITLTIPTGLFTGLKFRVVQAGSGKVTIAGSGVTVNGKNGHLSTGGQWHVVDVIQTGGTQFVVYGDTGA